LVLKNLVIARKESALFDLLTIPSKTQPCKSEARR
jgi:hypothetical protein